LGVISKKYQIQEWWRVRNLLVVIRKDAFALIFLHVHHDEPLFNRGKERKPRDACDTRQKSR
jgi:hypothetical protein